MDPLSKRFVWDRVRDMVRDGKSSFVLTSHSMENCGALCGRIGIMVKGRFRCLGSNQHLKSRFGQGYILTMKLGGMKPNSEQAVNFIITRFLGAQLKEKQLNQVRFQLPVGVRALSTVFAGMCNGGPILNIEDYTILQTTLEDVFLSFAEETYSITKRPPKKNKAQRNKNEVSIAV